MSHVSHFRPPAPGEEVVLSLFPLSHISNLMLDVYYILSVAGTSVFPGYDVLKVNKDKELWELFTEVGVFIIGVTKILGLFSEMPRVTILILCWLCVFQ